MYFINLGQENGDLFEASDSTLYPRSCLKLTQA